GGEEFYDLIPLLAEGLVGEEREPIFRAVMSSLDGPTLRQRVTDSIGDAPARGTAADVSQRLEDAGRLQLLACLSNGSIVRMLDRQISVGSIRIPQYEVRNTAVTPPKLDQGNQPTDLSAFGARVRVARPILSTISEIWNAYSASGNLEDLGWRLRKRVGRPPRSALSEYMQRVSP